MSQSGQNILSMSICLKILYLCGKLTSMESFDLMNSYRTFHLHLHEKNNTTQSILSLFNKTYHSITCWEYANEENVLTCPLPKLRMGNSIRSEHIFFGLWNLRKRCVSIFVLHSIHFVSTPVNLQVKQTYSI